MPASSNGVFTRCDRRGNRSRDGSHRVNIHATGRAIDRGDRSLRRLHRVNKHATDRGDPSRDRLP